MTSTADRLIRARAESVSGRDASTPRQLLTRARSGREVIQQFVPLGQSIEWQLGQSYLRERGSKAFVSDSSPVPYVVNNDGALSRHAAEVLFEALSSQHSAVSPEHDIYVLELGVGVGLFARFFLDQFLDLCRKHGKSYYDRLCYIAGDRSPRMLLDVARQGVLAAHAGRYRLREVDALWPGETLPYDYGFESVVQGPWSVAEKAPKIFQAVFLNYLLDCLPAAVLEMGDREQETGDREQEIKQLCVRTCVGRHVNLAEFTDMSLEQLRERAARVTRGEGGGASERARKELLEVYGLFASEYRYLPLDAGVVGDEALGEMKNEERKMKNEKPEKHCSIPHLDFAVEFARKHGIRRVVHSYGAIQCLEGLLPLVADDGLILINDYGQADIKEENDFEHQRFSLATFAGVNFPLLRAYFAGEQKGTEATEGHSPLPPLAPVQYQWSEPFRGDAGGIHSRLLGRKPSAATVQRFQTVFGGAQYERIHQPVERARECVKVGRFEQAAALYEQALERQSSNWLLLSEVAGFLTFTLRDPKAGADMAKCALELNPACSSDLWCTLGDALFEWGRTAEAKGAYVRALQISESDVRARFNLAFVHAREKDYTAALEMIAQALALDRTGQYRDKLLQKQQEVLALVAARHQQDFLLMANLVSKPAEDETRNSNVEIRNKHENERPKP